MYINSLGQNHVASVLESVSGILEKKQAFLPVLYHVGDYRNPTPQMEAKLAQQGVLRGV